MAQNNHNMHFWEGDFERESWDHAAERVKSLGYYASSFSTCIRHLRQFQRSTTAQPTDLSPNGLDSRARFLLGRLMLSPTIKSHVYYLSLTHYESALKGKEYISSEDLTNLYSPDALASLLGLIYLFRQIKPKCDPTEWAHISKVIQEVCDIGTSIGIKVRGLDVADGILVPAVRYLALCLCMQLDLRKFQGYRRSVIKEKRGFNLKEELRLWGCTHVQMAALLLEMIGFGARYAEDFKTALCSDPTKKISFAANRLRTVAVYTDALYLGVEIPSIQGEEEFEISETAIADLGQRAKSILENGSSHSWLLKSRIDIAPRLVPELYPEDGSDEHRRYDKLQKKKRYAFEHPPVTADSPSMQRQLPPEIDAVSQEYSSVYEQAPESVREQFSEKEFEELGNEISALLEK